MNLTLKVWRQKNANTPGQFETYQARNIIPDMSFLEMLDVVNEDILARGEEPIAFDSDCREERDVIGYAVAHRRIRIVHEAAAVFNDEGRTAKILDVRQGFEQHLGFSGDFCDVHCAILGNKG